MTGSTSEDDSGSREGWALTSGHHEDYTRFAKAMVGYLATAIVPRRLDSALMRRFLRSNAGVHPETIARVEERMRLFLGARLPDADFEQLAREYCCMAREDQWLRWRALHGPRLNVDTNVEGLEHLQAARENVGKGALLWGLSFCETLMVKVGLHRAGVGAVHLSTEMHGAPTPYSAFGLRYMVALHARSEDHFLRERVLIPVDGSLGYLRVLLKRLSENRCVYMTAEGASARRMVRRTLFGRSISFPTGAPALAWKSGAPLLPVYVVREGLLRYRVVVEAPVELDRSAGKREFVEDAGTWLAQALERLVVAHPSSWSWVGYPTILSLLAADGRRVQY